MQFNQNEKYLLKFISGADDCSIQNNELLKTIQKLGIKLEFNDYNPVYKIIDELTYSFTK